MNNVSFLNIPEGFVSEIYDSKGNKLWSKSDYNTCLVSNGTQVLDTGVYCSSTMSCEIKIAWTAFPSNATYIGAIEKEGSTYYRCHFQCSILGSSRLIGFWQDSPFVGNAVSIPFDTKPHILTYSAQNMTAGIDGAITSHGNSPTPSNSTFYLFDRHVVGFTANAEPGKCKIYYAKFWDNEELIRHFIPVIYEDGRPALYDLVSHQYYFDLNGNNFNYIKES